MPDSQSVSSTLRMNEGGEQCWFNLIIPILHPTPQNLSSPKFIKPILNNSMPNLGLFFKGNYIISS